MNLNKFLAGVALAAILASCSGKNEDKPTPKTPGTLTSLALLASDNSDLTEDIVISDITSSAPMVVRIDGGGKGKTLVATVTAGENDVITDGAGSVITNGKITFDASYALDIIVRNTESKLSTAYELKVGKILKTVVTKLASYYEDNAETGMSKYFNMAINPADGTPYIVYLRKATVEGVTDAYNLASVVKWNPSSQKMELVGAPGFPSEAVKAVAIPLYISFDKNNAPEVLYSGGEVANLLSAKKYNGSSWADLGTPGFGEKCSTSMGTSEIYKHPVSGDMGLFITSYVSKSDANFRCHVNFSFDGSSWSTKHDVLAGIPKASGTSNVFYCAGGVNTSSAAYVITSANGNGYSVYKSADGDSWSNVVNNFLPDGSEYGVPSPVLRLDKDGNIYAFVANVSAKTIQAYKLDESKATLVPYASGLAVHYNDKDTPDEGAAMAINPVTNEFFAAKVNKGTSKIEWFVIDPDTKQWTESKTIEDAGTSPAACQVAYNASGVGYLSYYLQTMVEGKTITTIELCKIDFEDDILPE